jgi:hypothetical protein
MGNDIKERAKLLAEMDDIVRHLDDESACMCWLENGIPDGAEEDELEGIASSDESMSDITRLFAALVVQYGHGKSAFCSGATGFDGYTADGKTWHGIRSQIDDTFCSDYRRQLVITVMGYGAYELRLMAEDDQNALFDQTCDFVFDVDSKYNGDVDARKAACQALAEAYASGQMATIKDLPKHWAALKARVDQILSEGE